MDLHLSPSLSLSLPAYLVTYQLMYCNRSILEQKTEMKGSIALQKDTVLHPGKCSIGIVCKGRTFQLATESDAEALEWIRAINDVLEQL
jgi:hypothetical protein